MTEPTPAPENEQPPPRAFAQGTGVLLQTVGVLMFLSTCCVCSTSFLWDPVQSPAKAVEQIRNPSLMVKDPAKRASAMMILTMTLGGLAMASFGLGLQADRKEAATGAVVTTGSMTVVLGVVGVGLWISDSGAGARLFHALLLLLTIIMTGFAIAAWREIRNAPPPADIDIVPPGTKIPYSFYHDDPPEVRLANEIAERRRQIEEEQAALDKLEEDLKNKQAETDQENHP